MSRSNPVVPMLLLAGACLVAVEAEAVCINPNECLCLSGATAVVRAQPETPWIVDVTTPARTGARRWISFALPLHVTTRAGLAVAP